MAGIKEFGYKIGDNYNTIGDSLNLSFLPPAEGDAAAWFGAAAALSEKTGTWGNVTIPASGVGANTGPLPNCGSEIKYITQVFGESGKLVQTAYAVSLNRKFARSVNGTVFTPWSEIFTQNSPEINFAGIKLYKDSAAGMLVIERDGASILQSGTMNVALGVNALSNRTTGVNNTGVGNNALEGVTVGGQNVAVGRNAGRYTAGYAAEMQNPQTSIFIGGNTKGPSADNVVNAIVIGIDATSQGSNSITLGNNAITKLSCQVTAITAFSDTRIKEDIQPADIAQCLEDVIALPVTRYKYKDFTGAHVDKHVTGWLADDVERVFPKAVSASDQYFNLLDEDGSQMYKEDGETPETFLMEDVKEITMTEALPTLWGAVQYLREIAENLSQRISALENK
ncbi:hypothetical protein AGMMS49975_00030 [Clostridia bacterium]|nr:hypothetical protein AGMMS49975_00030 [Clostridia bacterium]